MTIKIFLTGGTGMVGRNILEHPSFKKYNFIAPSSHQLNLLDRDEVKSFLSKEMPDLIIHSAGLVGGIQANIKSPVDFLLKNADIGLNVISSAASVGVKNLINLGSSCMYPRNAFNPLDENLILKGELEPTNEGYALAKIVASRLCEYIVREDPNKNYKTVIPCNLYGRHDKYDEVNSHLIPAVIKKIHEAKLAGTKTVSIWGDGSARREFMTAKDLADFIYFAINRLEIMPQNINVGLGHDYSISDYYHAVAAVVGFEGNFEYDLTKPIGMQKKLVDISNLKSFGWNYKTELQDGISEAYKFFKESL
jgi:GDP-L-fucose synthase